MIADHDLDRVGREGLPRSQAHLLFERERLLNLIDSKIRRREMDAARSLAGELFDAEFVSILFQKVMRVRKYRSALLTSLFLMVGLLSASTLSMVMNISPLTNLIIQAVTLGVILAAIGLYGFVIARVEHLFETISERYDSLKQSFIERLFENFPSGGAPEVRLLTELSGMR